jgi:hypothetical protein
VRVVPTCGTSVCFIATEGRPEKGRDREEEYRFCLQASWHVGCDVANLLLINGVVGVGGKEGWGKREGRRNGVTDARSL